MGSVLVAYTVTPPHAGCGLTFADLFGGLLLSGDRYGRRNFLVEKLAEMPLSVGFSCGKRPNCDLNLDSDERT